MFGHHSISTMAYSAVNNTGIDGRYFLLASKKRKMKSCSKQRPSRESRSIEESIYVGKKKKIDRPINVFQRNVNGR